MRLLLEAKANVEAADKDGRKPSPGGKDFGNGGDGVGKIVKGGGDWLNEELSIERLLERTGKVLHLRNFLHGAKEFKVYT